MIRVCTVSCGGPSFPRTSGFVYLITAFAHTPYFSSFTGPVSLTIPAHRIMTKAYEIGGPAAQSALITLIFRAYYEDDLDISDPDVLADAAEQAAIMSKDEVSIRKYLWQRSRNPSFWRGLVPNLSGSVMVTELDIGFLGTELREFR